MNKKRKFKIRFFTIAEFKEEEEWLRNQHKNGWKLVKIVMSCIYIFEKCKPEDVIYRLDFTNSEETSDYMQIFSDYGWEYLGKHIGWLYFRKSASEIDYENEGEIFSDNESKVEMLQKIMGKRMLPIMFIFLCIVLPQTVASMHRTKIVLILWLVILALYVYLLLYCGLKILKLRKMYDHKKHFSD